MRYLISFPALGRHEAHVHATMPTDGQPALDVMMPTWTPGVYRPEDYADAVDSVLARAADGSSLSVQRTRRNHWRIDTRGTPAVTLTYRLRAASQDPTANWVGDSVIVLNGPATYLTPVGGEGRPAYVTLALPAGWTSLASLDTASDHAPNHYRASSYDALADAPIVAGRLETVQFDVAGATHMLVDAGPAGDFSGERAGRALLRLVVQTQRFWGFLPYPRYEFLNVFGGGAAGPPHLNSTLLTARATTLDTPQDFQAWLVTAARGYFAAFNGTRLHPAEFTPLDREAIPSSPSLWIADGLNDYYAELMVARAGLARPQDFLDRISALIARLQNDAGRRVQTLTAASLDAGSRAARNARAGRTLNVAAKGAVVALLLDAHIRTLTKGARSLDDVLRLAYLRYSGTAGYTADQFRAAASEVAGTDLSDWFAHALDSTDELDYTELLAWYGLEFTGGRRYALHVVDAPAAPALPLAPPDTSAGAPPTFVQQQQHLQALLKADAGPAPGPAADSGSVSRVHQTAGAAHAQAIGAAGKVARVDGVAVQIFDGAETEPAQVPLQVFGVEGGLPRLAARGDAQGH